MSSKNENTPSREPTLKDIDKKVSDIVKHLERQGRQMAQGAWLTTAIFGSSIIMIAVSLQVGGVLSLTDPRYIFLFIFGFGIMAWARYKVRKIKS